MTFRAQVPSVRDCHVAAPGGRLFARVWGGEDLAGEDLAAAAFILFHDSLGCVELWRDFPAKLSVATGLRVVAYDRLGFGRSDPRRDRLVPPDFIARESEVSLPALRRELSVERMILFGHSVGGGMAAAAGAAFPESTLAVATVAAQAFVDERTLAGIRMAAAEFEQPDRMKRLTRYHGDKAQWVLDAWVQTWLDPAFTGWTLDDDLRRLRCPVLALHGDRDEFGSSAHPERIARLAVSGRCAILQDCGHIPHREKPERLVAELRAFVAPLLAA
jgi:pimeloyl-ACP methyl ester carboxylesterase